MHNKIVLVGPMGAGKSTIGRMLASYLGYEFLDTDHVIEKRAGADISWIFDVEGEEGFRVRETAVLEELCNAAGDTVIATGGGIVIRDENRMVLSRFRSVVYLSASIGQLVARTAKDKKRPLLQVDDPDKKIIELVNARDPLYCDVSDVVVRTDRKNPKLVVQEIVKVLKL
ncbi:MAG: shikimate kinase [Flavobacteriales bacterium]